MQRPSSRRQKSHPMTLDPISGWDPRLALDGSGAIQSQSLWMAFPARRWESEIMQASA